MEVKIKKLLQSEVGVLTSLFKHKDEQAELESAAQNIARGIVDIYVLYFGSLPIGELRVRYDSGNTIETIDWKRVYLFAFRIIKKYRNKGFGSYLIDYVLTDCNSRGYSEYTIGVESSNNHAKHIYSKIGFNTVLAHKVDSWNNESYEYDLLLKVNNT